MTRLVKTRSTVCKHLNTEVCFHGVCKVLKTLREGTLLIENEEGFVNLIAPDKVKEVETNGN